MTKLTITKTSKWIEGHPPCKETVTLPLGFNNWGIRDGHLWWIKQEGSTIKRTYIPLYAIERLEVEEDEE